MASTTTTIIPTIHLSPFLTSTGSYQWQAHGASFTNLQLPALAISIAAPPRDEMAYYRSLLALRREAELLTKELSRHGATKAIVLRLPGTNNPNDAIIMGKAFKPLTLVKGLKRFAIEACTPEAAQSIAYFLDPFGRPAKAETTSPRRYEAAFDIQGEDDVLEDASLLDAPINDLCPWDFPVLAAGQL